MGTRDTSMDEAIKLYFNLGLPQKEILECLAHMNRIVISKRSLQNHLKRLGLFRKKYFSDIHDVGLFINEQLKKSGKLLGYRLMHLKCIQNGFTVTQETVRLMLKLFDPNGVNDRVGRKLRRRIYTNYGPWFLLHMDAYDKLSPYGIGKYCTVSFNFNFTVLYLY